MKKIMLILMMGFVAISCNETEKKEVKEIAKKEVAAIYRSLEVEIEGMTCEIGCARLIESKLSKVDGVVFSKVEFEAKKGQFTYDINKLTKDDIVRKINGIAGGNLYLVTRTTDIEEINAKKH